MNNTNNNVIYGLKNEWYMGKSNKYHWCRKNTTISAYNMTLSKYDDSSYSKLKSFDTVIGTLFQ